MKRALTNQELLDRYVHSVKAMLPPDKADDIAAEIRSNLESLAEDRAIELGHELSLDDMSAILKQHGHPVAVAGRYRDRPGRGLIGPELFPFYWFTVRAIFGTWVTVRVIIAVFALQGTTPAVTTLKYLGRDIMLAAFFIAAGVTMVFAAWEYLEFKFRYSERWKPESLPAVAPPIRPPKQPRPVVQLVGNVVWLIFLATALYSPWMFRVWGGRGVFSPSETVYAMRLSFWLLALCLISQSWLGATRFATAEWRPLLRIAINIAGLFLVVHLLRGGDLLVAGPRFDPSQVKPLATLNQGAAGVLMLACISWALQCVYEVRRFVRAKGWRMGGGRQAAGSAS